MRLAPSKIERLGAGAWSLLFRPSWVHLLLCAVSLVDPFPFLSNSLRMAKTRRSLPRKSYTETGVVDNMNRRLTESEVKSIFACVVDNKGPAENIAFKIIKTQNNKPMLSPPALEFEGESRPIPSISLYPMCSVVFISRRHVFGFVLTK